MLLHVPLTASMTKTHGLLKLKASSADDSAELTLLPVLTFSANGSAPLCYNITSDEFEEISLFGTYRFIPICLLA